MTDGQSLRSRARQNAAALERSEHARKSVPDPLHADEIAALERSLVCWHGRPDPRLSVVGVKTTRERIEFLKQQASHGWGSK